MTTRAEINAQALARCQAAFSSWRAHTVDDFDFADPKGFSSFTMQIRARPGVDVDPPAVLYRQLEGKENAILDFEAERAVFRTLSTGGVAPTVHAYDRDHRLEGFYEGRTLTRHDLDDPETLTLIAAQLWAFHHLEPPPLPRATFFELLHDTWSPLARATLDEHRHVFPDHEQPMLDALDAITSLKTRAMVRDFLPTGPPTFCHNDTYHGNIMKLADGRVRLLDFEFSCLNHVAFDFSNLFAETVTRHGLPDYPHFRIVEPTFDDASIGHLVSAYLDHGSFGSPATRAAEHTRLVTETRQMLPLSDYMYAMAALPLAVKPIQKIRFIPYAHQRLQRFQAAWAERFAGGRARPPLDGS